MTRLDKLLDRLDLSNIQGEKWVLGLDTNGQHDAFPPFSFWSPGAIKASSWPVGSLPSAFKKKIYSEFPAKTL